MRRRSRFRGFPAQFVAGAILLVASVPALSAQHNQPRRFDPPHVLTASDIVYPINSGAAGVVVVAVGLDDAGMIKSTDVLRDVPSLTSPVLLAIRKWTFKPATFDGRAVDSTIVVSIVFNPCDYRLGGADTPAFGKELKVLSPDENGFLPPKIIAAAWAEYPANSVSQGGVVLDARVSHRGRVTHVDAIWAPFLRKTSEEAVRKWTFTPAEFRGEPVAASAVVGYVFRPPNIAVPVAPFRPTQ
jgi:Gram-negative bacterial TonB protein C-terminal